MSRWINDQLETFSIEPCTMVKASGIQQAKHIGEDGYIIVFYRRSESGGAVDLVGQEFSEDDLLIIMPISLPGSPREQSAVVCVSIPQQKVRVRHNNHTPPPPTTQSVPGIAE